MNNVLTAPRHSHLFVS